MATVICKPKEYPKERHVIVHAHRDPTIPAHEKGYYFVSDEKDHGGSGTFDWRLDEAIKRATNFANKRGISIVVVKSRPPR